MDDLKNLMERLERVVDRLEKLSQPPMIVADIPVDIPSPDSVVYADHKQFAYSGDGGLCSKCGMFGLRRTGTCFTCQYCGEGTGCS